MTEVARHGWVRVGVDVADERDLATTLSKPAVRRRVFSDLEVARCLEFGEGSSGAFARCFAAKEAVLKASGIEGATLKEIQILHDDSGAPYVSWARLQLRRLQATVSTSSSGTLAVAAAVVYPVGTLG